VSVAPPPRFPAVTILAAGTQRAAATDEALLYRSEEGDIQAIRTLLEGGAPPDARDPAGRTPLMLAVIHGHPAIVELLIAQGAGVNVQNRAGLTPLMLAAINNHAAVLRTLLDRGAELDARTKAGWTALTYAAWRGYPDIVRLLLARGADPNVTDRQGWTALQHVNWHAAQPASSDDPSDMPTAADPLRMAAAGPGHDEVIALLRQAGARP
jgi:ankyrin repeat protein